MRLPWRLPQTFLDIWLEIKKSSLNDLPWLSSNDELFLYYLTEADFSLVFKVFLIFAAIYIWYSLPCPGLMMRMIYCETCW